MKKRYISATEMAAYIHGDGTTGVLRNSSREMRFNHLDCPAGADTKARLYIRRTDRGHLAYCHNCGLGGFLGDPKDPLTGTVPQGGRTLTETWDGTQTAQYSATENKDWERYQYEYVVHKSTSSGSEPCDGCAKTVRSYFQPFKPEWLSKYNAWALSDYTDLGETHRLILPAALDKEGKPTVFSVKYFRLDKEGKQVTHSPKWRHYTPTRTIPPIIDNPGYPMCVIVEDRISAISVVEATGGAVSACTLSGTHISQENLFKLSMLFERFFIMLDNDSEEVREKARAMSRTLRTYGRPAPVYMEAIDPKNITPEVLVALIHKELLI